MNFQELSEHIVVKEALLKQRSDVNEYRKYLENNGWTVIGSGSYGVVFEKLNKNYVLKVYEDLGYDLFLEFLEDHINNPHFPNIKRKIIQNNPDRFLGVVAIEKLKPIKTDKIKWISDLTNEFSATLNAHTRTSKNSSFEEVLNSFKSNYMKYHKNELEKDKEYIKDPTALSSYARRRYANIRKCIDRLDFYLENYLPIAKSLYDLSTFIKDKGLQDKGYFDLHLGNFMIRPSTGEIVITDPLV